MALRSIPFGLGLGFRLGLWLGLRLRCAAALKEKWVELGRVDDLRTAASMSEGIDFRRWTVNVASPGLSWTCMDRRRFFRSERGPRLETSAILTLLGLARRTARQIEKVPLFYYPIRGIEVGESLQAGTVRCVRLGVDDENVLWSPFGFDRFETTFLSQSKPSLTSAVDGMP